MELTEQKLIELMREEWDRKVLHLEKAVRAFMKTPEGEKLILSAGLKARSRLGGILYTVSMVDKARNVVILRSPEGEEFPVSGEDFEGEKPKYELA